MHTTSTQALDPGRAGVETIETHVSSLFFTPDGLVHKRKKPVRFAFVDQSTPERREQLCQREVELNRRFSPDVYVDVEEIVDSSGHVVDHAVLMRRMPAERRLATLVHSGADVHRCLAAVVRVVAAHHAHATRSAAIDAVGTSPAVAGLWRTNVDEMGEFVPGTIDAAELTAIDSMAHRFVTGRGRLFLSRIDQGLVVDGHGDLLADDIFCLDDGPRILDCLEFDDRLRWGDVLLDIGFLSMDLEHRGHPELARYVLAEYELASGTAHPPSLEHHYTAYRALVRAKVSCLKRTAADRGEAQRYIEQCLQHLHAGRVLLVVVGGLPGTGKSTLATGLAERLGCSLVRSDEVRKSLAGLQPFDHRPAPYGESLYAEPLKERTYTAVFDAARQRLQMGDSVIIDASFSDAHWRVAARKLAADAAADLSELQCVLPPALADERLRARTSRGDDASDADTAVASIMRQRFDRWPEAKPIDTVEPAARAVDAALDHVRRSDSRVPVSSSDLQPRSGPL